MWVTKKLYTNQIKPQGHHLPLFILLERIGIAIEVQNLLLQGLDIELPSDLDFLRDEAGGWNLLVDIRRCLWNVLSFLQFPY